MRKRRVRRHGHRSKNKSCESGQNYFDPHNHTSDKRHNTGGKGGVDGGHQTGARTGFAYGLRDGARHPGGGGAPPRGRCATPEVLHKIRASTCLVAASLNASARHLPHPFLQCNMRNHQRTRDELSWTRLRNVPNEMNERGCIDMGQASRTL
jgi:hypothetical protein